MKETDLRPRPFSTGDTVELVAVHRRHNPKLKARKKQRGRVIDVIENGKLLVEFEGGACRRFWIAKRWLKSIDP